MRFVQRYVNLIQRLLLFTFPPQKIVQNIMLILFTWNTEDGNTTNEYCTSTRCCSFPTASM